MPRETIMCGENGVEHVWMRGAEFCRCGAERLTNDVDDVDDTDDETAVRCPWGHWNHVFTRDRTFCLCGAERRPDAVCDGDEHVWFCDDETCECGDVTNLRHHPQFDPPVPTQIEADDPDFDGDRRFPRLTEDRDGTIWSVPFRNSQMYRRHCRQWSKRPPADALADLRRLLPRLKSVRSVSTAKQRQLHQERQDLNKGIIKERIPDDTALFWFVRANERWQPNFWRELKRHDLRLILQIERACRQGPNKIAGRKSGKRLTTVPTPEQREQMRTLAAELRPQVGAAKTMFRNGRKGQALQRLEQIADSVGANLSKQLGKCGGIFRDSKGAVHVDKKPHDIVIWLVAKKFHVSLPNTKTVLAGQSAR